MYEKQGDDESAELLNDKRVSYDTNSHHQRHSSRLEWAESSWTRFFHILCWFWVNPILSLGFKRQLTENDLDDIPNIDKSSVLLSRLHSYDWSSTTTSRIIIKVFWKDYIFVILLLLPFLIVRIAPSILFRQIIVDMMNKQELDGVTYFYGIFLFICMNMQTLVRQQIIFRSSRIAVRIRNALTLIIYMYSLRLKSASWQQTNTGHAFNLIASDAFKFEQVCAYLFYVFEGLVEAIVIFGLLCWMIHPIPAICGYALFPFFILIQLHLSRKFGQCREITSICSDKRIQAISELIHGCHIVKMYNWEKPMEDRITKMRHNELASIRRTSRFRAFNATQLFISVSLFALTTFGSAWLLGYPLNTANTFPVLSLFALMRNNVMRYLPTVIEKLSEVRSSSKRIDSFLRLTIKQQYQSSLSTSSINQQQKGSIIMSNASFSWHNEISCLSSLDLTINQGTFVGIIGPVGSGKSSLLVAILGELNLLNGEINTNDSSFSYAPQTPWIFPDIFRNNILLNRTFDEEQYRNVIHACCLDVDLNFFGSNGDRTMIGERGVNLSGGQKARISLARALYADADIYLIDDPLSAVDRTVAKQIYERCFGSNGLLKNKTRLLVTHQTEFLYESHQRIFLSHGYIDKQGFFNGNIIKEDDTNKKQTSILSDILDENTPIVDTQPIITKETSLGGDVKWSLWYHLFSVSPSGRFGFCLLIVLLLLGEVLNDGTSYCLSLWLKQSQVDHQHRQISAYIYFGLIIGTVLVDIIRTNYYFTVILHGSNYLHNNMVRGLLYTSVQFFESNPSGRILNRASKDQQVVDEILPAILLDSVIALLFTIGSMFIICLVNPSYFVLLLILIPSLGIIIRFYHKACHQLKRLESNTRSSVYSLFSSSMNGTTTIRAFKAENGFIQSICERIDENTCAYISLQGASQWLSIRLGAVCSLIILILSLQILFFPNGLSLPTAGLSLMSAISVTSWFQWAVRQFCEADILMSSVERLDEYSHLSREEDKGGHKRLVKISDEWPLHGRIEFRNYSLRHRLNLNYAIKNINLQIKSGEKIGIIGRTGAGKSSVFKGIFRFVERACVDGIILIDDIDISRVTLNQLRSKLSVIPQQPVLFSGTLRYNLDPFDHYSDEQCWLALEDVQLKQFVSNHSAGLLMPITESGNNLSVGECQLICIARVILKKSKILLIDEATANVDQNTDDLIQKVITQKFQDSTVITIAHRLNTLAKSDRIIVLDKGIIVNNDTPMNILYNYS